MSPEMTFCSIDWTTLYPSQLGDLLVRVVGLSTVTVFKIVRKGHVSLHSNF